MNLMDVNTFLFEKYSGHSSETSSQIWTIPARNGSDRSRGPFQTQDLQKQPTLSKKLTSTKKKKHTPAVNGKRRLQRLRANHYAKCSLLAAHVALLDALRAPLAALRTLWAALGPLLAALGPLLGALGPLLATLGHSWVALGPSGTTLWALLGAFGRSWGALGRFYGVLGRSWAALGRS